MLELLVKVFLIVLKLSITGSFCNANCFVSKVFIKKAPKILSYALWAIVFIRLICPISISSSLSFFKFLSDNSSQDISNNINALTTNNMYQNIISNNGVIGNHTDLVKPISYGNAENLVLVSLSGNLDTWNYLYINLYNSILYKVKKKGKNFNSFKENIYENENIKAPFVFGIVKPKIYVPIGFMDEEKNYILKHEEIHIKRFDYIIKPITFLILMIHWFNPFVWISFMLMTRDMEMSCDEKVLRNIGIEIKKDYSTSLLALAVKGSIIASPLAFGENNVKSRIKNVLKYKKPAILGVIVGALVIVLLSISLLTNPVEKIAPINNTLSIVDEVGASTRIVKLVEDNLSIIMSSPKESSNPEDYIKANKKAYEEIIKNGGEDALNYMLFKFQTNEESGLKGHIMMRLCKELLGVRNNVTDQTLSPGEWYSKLNIRKKIELPDFKYSGNDPVEELVYNTIVTQNKSSRGCFVIVAPHIFGSYKEKNKLKVFTTTYISDYILYDKILEKDGGGIIPTAITYIKNSDGSYTLEKYEISRDGTLFSPSIKDFCTMPVSGRKILGLANKILKHYGNYEDVIKLERENLIKHMKANKQEDVYLYKINYKESDELIKIN